MKFYFKFIILMPYLLQISKKEISFSETLIKGDADFVLRLWQ